MIIHRICMSHCTLTFSTDPQLHHHKFDKMPDRFSESFLVCFLFLFTHDCSNTIKAAMVSVKSFHCLMPVNVFLFQRFVAVLKIGCLNWLYNAVTSTDKYRDKNELFFPCPFPSACAEWVCIAQLVVKLMNAIVDQQKRTCACLSSFITIASFARSGYEYAWRALSWSRSKSKMRSWIWFTRNSQY